MPPWYTVYQQTQRWIQAEVLEDVARVPRLPLSGLDRSVRAGYDGAKRRKGAKVHLAVDTLGHLLAPLVTPADTQERAQEAALAEAVQEATGAHVEVALVGQGYTGDAPAEAAAEHGICLEIVGLPEAKRGFVLLPRRWVVERPFAWTARFRRLARDHERLAATRKGLHLLAFTVLMRHYA